MAVNYLDREMMEEMCHRLAVAVFDKKEEPIASFDDHSNDLLESAINLPRATYDGKELYPTLIDKAAVLYYHLNKNHPFNNGNKRIATASLLVFLYINNHWLLVDKNEFFEKTLSVAKSNPSDREAVLDDLKLWIKKHVTAINQ